MSETLQYIDTYFNGGLSPTEKAAFENRCESDLEFAEDVAFYISARAELKNELFEQKKTEFHELYVQLSSAGNGIKKKSILVKLFPYAAVAAAACVLFILGWQLFFKDVSSKNQASKQLADRYIRENIQQLGVSMGGDKDSLELGIQAFNNKDYQKAEGVFRALSTRQTTKPEGIKNLGLVYLVTGRYDQAISQFDSLASLTSLYANPGLFYKALALMERSSKGDREMAKKLLEEVIAKDLQGNKEAKVWIQKL